jgi:hypothetical protein
MSQFVSPNPVFCCILLTAKGRRAVRRRAVYAANREQMAAEERQRYVDKHESILAARKRNRDKKKERTK